MHDTGTEALAVRRHAAAESAEWFGDLLASRPNQGATEAPLDDLRELGALGLLTAPLPEAHGGLGLGTEAGGHAPLLRVLAGLGAGDLALGRLYEGHVNALILIAAFGSPAQLRRAAQDAADGLLFGVWNTGVPELMSIAGVEGSLSLVGCKSFATGAAFVRRPIVTAERGGWQMTLPRMESPEVASALAIDRSSWAPLGMESSESYTIDFTGARLASDNLIGAPGDFYRDPLFRGGAVRFAAVQAGAIVRLYRLFAAWLDDRNRGGDPYQIARLGEVALAAQEAILWLERAAAISEDCMTPYADESCRDRMIECANMTRLAIERLATATMPRIVAGVGAHGLLRPARFERILRDLTMYLRQPNPDGTLADAGRAALRHRDVSLWHNGGAARG